MAKNRAIAEEHQNGAIRGQSPMNGKWAKRDDDSAPIKGVRREILFPTEPSTIGRKKIDRAVERVAARKK